MSPSARRGLQLCERGFLLDVVATKLPLEHAERAHDSLLQELCDIFIARAREAMEVRLVAFDAEHTVRHQYVGMNVKGPVMNNSEHRGR